MTRPDFNQAYILQRCNKKCILIVMRLVCIYLSIQFLLLYSKFILVIYLSITANIVFIVIFP